MQCPVCPNNETKQLTGNRYICAKCHTDFEIHAPSSIKEHDANESEWSRVEAEIQRNTQDRIDWKPILRMSLTKAVALLKLEGLDGNTIYEELCKTHPELSDEQKRRMRIGIAARLGETDTYESAKQQVTR